MGGLKPERLIALWTRQPLCERAAHFRYYELVVPAYCMHQPSCYVLPSKRKLRSLDGLEAVPMLVEWDYVIGMQEARRLILLGLE